MSGEDRTDWNLEGVRHQTPGRKARNTPVGVVHTDERGVVVAIEQAFKAVRPKNGGPTQTFPTTPPLAEVSRGMLLEVPGFLDRFVHPLEGDPEPEELAQDLEGAPAPRRAPVTQAQVDPEPGDEAGEGPDDPPEELGGDLGE